MKTIKVLFVHGGTLKKAGTEAFMMNVFRNVDPKRVHIDFLVFGREEGVYDKEVILAGSKIFRIPYTVQDMQLKGLSYSVIHRLIKNENYDIVHSHMNALNGIILGIMKKIGIPVRISHSHGSKHFVDSKILSKLQDFLMKGIPNVATNLLACSKEAGDFLYGKHTYVIMNNGIDVTKYAYDPLVRKTQRVKYGIEDKFVIGHVGRFNFQKNHAFLIKVFKEYHALNPSSHLLLVGEGELLPEIKQQIATYKLQDSVTFTGVLDSTHEILQAFDCFVMPSLFEGLPYVLVEAQCAGLLCISADTIDSGTKMIDPFYFLPLRQPEKWASLIFNSMSYTRVSQSDVLVQRGFDVRSNVTWLMNYYESILKGVENEI